MSNNRFDDAVLSAIIDGEAEPEIVASVNADAAASERLEYLRQAVQIVGTEPSPATAERRSASIAAAMAAATPAAPEVTSLAAARHQKAEKKRRSMPTAWIAAVAAAVAFVIAIPIAIGLGIGGETADTATTATDSAEEAVEEATDAAADAADDAADAAEDVSAADDDAMEADEAAADDSADDAMEEAVVDHSGDAEDPDAEPTDMTEATIPPPPPPTTVPTPVDVTSFELTDLPIVSNAAELDQRLGEDVVVPFYTADEVAIAGVRQDCIVASELVTGPAPYALVTLSPFGGADRLLLVEFADNGVTRALDAEDCALLG